MSDRRYFTREEALSLLPWLKDCFTRIVQLRARIRALYETLDARGHRPDEASLKLDTGPEDVRVDRARFAGLMEALQEELTAILAQGVEVKDIDTGLCDFWSYLDGNEVYLCWRYGEPTIGYYHDPHAGFAGRKPLPPLDTKPRILH